MSNLVLKGLTEVEGMKFHDIEGGFGQDKKSMLVKDIAEIHNRELKDINRNINNNINRFKKGIDILDLKNGGFDSLLQDLGFSSRDISISNNIFILSERGYSKLLKILEDDFAWEQYEKLVDGYFNMREKIKDNNIAFKQLSPELQMFNNLFKSLATTELEQKRLSATVKETKEELKTVREVIEIRPSNSWRGETNRLMTKICFKLKDYKKPKEEAYKALEERAGCDLKIRLKNMRARQALQGICKSKIDELNYLDVIAQDKKLIEIYVFIVGQMAIRNGVGTN